MLKSGPQERKHTVRMTDVAELANVSCMTVSRALRAPEKVAEETRERIFAAIKKTGYIPNRLAGNLSSSRSNVIGLIVPSLRNSLFSETIQATADVLARAGFHVQVAESGHSIEEEEDLIAAFIGQRVSGIILHNTTHTERARALLQDAQLPVIETGDLTRDPIDTVVSYSNLEAAEAMTRYLLRRGYKRIGFVSLHTHNNDRARVRRLGYLAALEAANITPNPRLMREVASGLAAGREALLELLAETPRPDAIFFAGDVLAIGAALECQRQGLTVPGDVAIATFDDLSILNHLVPTITSLRLPRREIGSFAAEVLLQRILSLESGIVEKDLGFDIVQRQST